MSPRKPAVAVLPEKVGYQKPEEGLINHSQLAEWEKCRYRWNLATNRDIHSRGSIRALDMGSAVHAGLAAASRGRARLKKWTKLSLPYVTEKAQEAVVLWLDNAVKLRGGLTTLSEEERTEYEDINRDGVEITIKAVRDFRLERWKPIWLNGQPLVEQSLVGPINPKTGWKGFHFTPDFVGEDLEEGGNWVLDLKVRKQFTPAEAEEVNLQLAGYQRELNQLGVPTVGSIMRQVKSVPPRIPKLNKDGSMSRADINTTWEVYRQALYDNGLDPEDYPEMQSKLLVHEFYREDRVLRSEEEQESIWTRIIERVAASMFREKGHNFRHWNMGPLGCVGCWAWDFCHAELRKEDTEFLLKTSYINGKDPQARMLITEYDLVTEGAY